MPTSFRDQLIQAIHLRRMVRFTYEDRPREVEPYMVLITSAGHDALSGYQTAGASSSDVVPGWKLFALDKLSDLHLGRRTFRVQPDYSPTTTACMRVLAQV